MAEFLHQLRLVVYPIIYRVSYIPGGARLSHEVHSTKTKCLVFRMIHGETLRYVFSGQIVDVTNIVPLKKGTPYAAISDHEIRV